MRLVPVMFTLIAMTLASPGWTQEVHREGAGAYSTSEVRDSLRVDTKRLIEIRSSEGLIGKLTIIAAKSKSVLLVQSRKAYTDRRSRAVDYLNLVAVNLTGTPQGARVEIKAPNPLPWDGEIESISVAIELIVPIGSEIEIEATYFDVTAVGPLASLVVPSSMGRLKASKITEKLELATVNQRVTIQDIEGEVVVSTSNATLIAKNITSRNSQASFRNKQGDIRIQNFTGEMEVKNEFGRIKIDGFTLSGTRSRIEGAHGPIDLELLRLDEARLIVNNRSEDINLTIPSDLDAALWLVVPEESEIVTNNFKFQADLVEQNRLKLICGDAGGSIRCAVRGEGNIYVTGGFDED
jgi:hypothetical protein